MADEQGEKTEQPSEHKLSESRKRGEVASSRELNSVIILVGVIMALVMSSVYMLEVLTEYFEWIYNIDIKKAFSPEMGKEILEKSIWVAAKSVMPVMVASFVLGILSQVMQIGFLYAPDVLQLKFERLNPVNGFKRVFSMKAVVETFKAIFKFMIVLVITYAVMKNNMSGFSGFLHADLATALSYGKDIAVRLSMFILMGLTIIAVADYAWEKYSYIKKLSMTKQELKQETKERDGNPEIKQKIRAIQREMSQKRMIAEVKKADVIVTNPTHISVAIKYDNETMIAPAITAKGEDHLALRIREIAKEHNIPIVENIPLARALHKTVKVGHGVPRSLYKAVAEILAFVYKLKKKQKALN